MYWLLVLSISFALANNVLLHLLSHKKLNYNGYLFNIFVSVVWAIILLVYNGGIGELSSTTLLFSLLYGLTLAGFLFFKQQSMTSGPIMLSSLIGCSAFVVTTLFNAIYWKEAMGAFEIVGIILMIVAVFTVSYKGKDSQSAQKLSLKWKICNGFFFLFAGMTGIVFRFHQSVDASHTNQMMIFASLVVVVMLSLLLAVQRVVKKRKNSLPSIDDGQPTTTQDSTKLTKKQIVASSLITVGCGIVSCVYNRLNIYLTGVLPSALFFPIFNGAIVILAAISGWVLFKEKATKRQIVGCCIGVLAVCCLSHFFGLV